MVTTVRRAGHRTDPAQTIAWGHPRHEHGMVMDKPKRCQNRRPTAY